MDINALRNLKLTLEMEKSLAKNELDIDTAKNNIENMNYWDGKVSGLSLAIQHIERTIWEERRKRA